MIYKSKIFGNSIGYGFEIEIVRVFCIRFFIENGNSIIRVGG